MSRGGGEESRQRGEVPGGKRRRLQVFCRASDARFPRTGESADRERHTEAATGAGGRLSFGSGERKSRERKTYEKKEVPGRRFGGRPTRERKLTWRPCAAGWWYFIFSPRLCPRAASRRRLN